MSLTLYFHPLSSYCHKALIALYENGIDFERRIIDLGNADDRVELAARWPLCKFPVIRDHARERDVPEATIIIEYLDRYFPGAQPLIPSDADDALDVRLWDRIFDNYVHASMQQIVSDRIHGSHGDMARERSMVATAYVMVDRHMAARQWIVGEAFSMADCAAAPALFYASTIVPFPDTCEHLAAYFERLVERPSYKRVLEEAKPYFAMYPFAENLPERFLV